MLTPINQSTDLIANPINTPATKGQVGFQLSAGYSRVRAIIEKTSFKTFVERALIQYLPNDNK